MHQHPSPAALAAAHGLGARQLAGVSWAMMWSEPTMAASSDMDTLLKASLLQTRLMPSVPGETLDLG